jgi:hypothetical protein
LRLTSADFHARRFEEETTMNDEKFGAEIFKQWHSMSRRAFG